MAELKSPSHVIIESFGERFINADVEFLSHTVVMLKPRIVRIGKTFRAVYRFRSALPRYHHARRRVLRMRGW